MSPGPERTPAVEALRGIGLLTLLAAAVLAAAGLVALVLTTLVA